MSVPTKENELKLLIDEEAYSKLLKHIPLKQQYDQINYYFDTPTHTLNASNITLRIRNQDNKFLLCLKVKNKKNMHSNFLSSLEYENEIDKYVFEEVIKSPFKLSDVIPSEAYNIISKIINFRELKYIGNIHNSRSQLSLFNEFLFELDKTNFPNNKVCYELEVEGLSTEDDSDKIVDYLNKINIKYSINKASKYSRFIKSICY
ncbi:CYTH domain-containing protein [Fictibacillus arsenicus]|uniref:CYTH domain-containing protein n=1 Tax=Fictibacillus arsenicus TaxID=255247 RepID=A0A1V3G4U6_9BACL|nr:CYTH domain-containing protein [Fictibacillus arsenicus]OOE10093.1 hypothetical protein UN64_16960 [Fictibacillus arsenicus]